VRAEREKWEQRYRRGEFSHDGPPSGLLVHWLPSLPKGRALDIATGLGRNALALAAAGYRVDAVDIAPTGLETARRRAAGRRLRVNWIEADLDHYALPANTYDVVISTFFLKRRLLPAMKAAVKPGGVLLFEAHLGTPKPGDGPQQARHRLRPGELRRVFSDWEILELAEGLFKEGDRTWELGRIAARKPTTASTPIAATKSRAAKQRGAARRPRRRA